MNKIFLSSEVIYFTISPRSIDPNEVMGLLRFVPRVGTLRVDIKSDWKKKKKRNSRHRKMRKKEKSERKIQQRNHENVEE